MMRHLPKPMVMALLIGALLVATAGSLGAEVSTETQTTRVPFADVVLNPCNGEEVALTGSLHITFHITRHGAGFSEYSAQVHIAFAGMSGAGASGASYRATGTSTQLAVLHQRDDNRWETSFMKATTQLIGQGGGGDNFATHLVYQLTVSASGGHVTLIDTFTEACRG